MAKIKEKMNAEDHEANMKAQGDLNEAEVDLTRAGSLLKDLNGAGTVTITDADLFIFDSLNRRFCKDPRCEKMAQILKKLAPKMTEFVEEKRAQRVEERRQRRENREKKRAERERAKQTRRLQKKREKQRLRCQAGTLVDKGVIA